MRVLAHELGHALLTRSAGPGQWTSDDPDPQQDPMNPGHNLNPENIMHPIVGPNPSISREQIEQVRKSALVKERPLVSGFTEGKPFKLGVKFKTINVKKSDDELFSDDALESSWVLRVTGFDAAGTEIAGPKQHKWNMDPLHWKNHDLGLEYLSVELPTAAHRLRITINGSDWDFWSGNDDLAAVDQTIPMGVDKWGTTSTAPQLPGAPAGDHFGSASDDNITYEATFNIRLEDEPRNTSFRSICPVA